MSKFKFDNYLNRKYRKLVNKGDYVYIYDINIKYEAKTIYKVHYAELAKGRILVEVDPKKNFIDSEYIKGWDYFFRSIPEEKLYELKKDKLYWWVCLWQQVQNPYVFKNE